MRKNGFTLSEFVLTFSVLGIIAVITLPGLIQNRDIVNLQSQLKRTYNELNDFAEYFQAEHSATIPSWVSENGISAFQDEFKNYFVETKNFSGSGYTVYEHNTDNVAAESLCTSTGMIKDLSGRIISFDDSPLRIQAFGSNKVILLKGFDGPMICVDINGPKSPNRYGVDIFAFLFTVNGDVNPSGDPSEKRFLQILNSGSSCYNDSYGKNCAYYALNDINPKDNTEGYWKDYVKKRKYLKSGDK